MSLRRLVVGGFVLTIDKAPFLVRLYRDARDIGFCGGTLLGERTVLSAAHCFDSYNGTVYVGTYQTDIFGDTSETYGGPQSLYPRAAHVHLYTADECRQVLGFTLSPSNLSAQDYPDPTRVLETAGVRSWSRTTARSSKWEWCRGG
jgi:hypothetical protein